MNIIKHAIKNNYKSILILEDDIILKPNFHKKVFDLEGFCKLHENWGIIYLGASQHNWDNIKIEENYYYANSTTGTFAYMVHNTFYQIILDELFKMKKPVDNYLVDIQKNTINNYMFYIQI